MRLRTRVVVLLQLQSALCVKIEQPLRSHDFLHFVVENLMDENGALEPEYQGRVNKQQDCQNRYIPKSKSGAQAQPQRSPHETGSLRQKPIPRTVCSSLTGYGSSIFLRRRAICTSITLSIGVNREVSCQMSFASISRETVRPRFSAR